MRFGSSSLVHDLTISIITGIVVSLVNLLVLKRLVQKKYYRRLLWWLLILGFLVAGWVWLIGPDKLRRYF